MFDRRRCLALLALIVCNPLLAAPERVVGLPCEGCEAVFDGLPETLTAVGVLAPPGEPGEPLRLSGVVRDQTGQAQSGVVIYAYQTDKDGRYAADPGLSGAAARHGRLRAWAQTDRDGHYAFDTIRPGAYPGRDVPQHIHLHVLERGRCTYYVGDVLFADDPRLTPKLREQALQDRGGSGVVRPTGSAETGWTATRNLTTGLNVPGYADCTVAR